MRRRQLLLAATAMPASRLARAAPKAEVVPADLKAVKAAIAAPGARAVLVNVWATWCEPCREEMPDILRLHREQRDKGLRLVLVSGDFLDQKADAEAFLSSLGVDFRSYLKRGDDMEFIDGLDPAWGGNLPASFLFDGKGARRHTFFGKVSYEALREKVTALLATSKQSNPRRGP